MNCPKCGKAGRKFGQTRHGQQRFQCVECRKTFSPPRPVVADQRRISRERAVMVLRMLLEGNSIRSTERLTGTHRDTILALMVEVGAACKPFLERFVHGVNVADVQCDEIWAFVGCKERTKQRFGFGEEFGDAYCFTAVERDSKLLVAWHLGKRCPTDTDAFATKLSAATVGRFQLTTDGYGPYQVAVPWRLAGRVDYGVLVKVYTNTNEGRYSPGEVTHTRTAVSLGNPDEKRICTSHVERSNLTIRMAIRRYTRLTNAFSKKWDNHEAMLALFFAYYNFCRVHSTLKTTPAVAAGIASGTWSVADLLAAVYSAK